MRRNGIRWAFGALTAIALSGCYSVPPYNSYPNMYGPPVQRMPGPRATYVMPGEFAQPVPQGVMMAPPMTTGVPQNTRSNQPAPNNSAPAADNPVPTPRDPSANGGSQPDRETSFIDDANELRLASNDEPSNADDFDPAFEQPVVKSQRRSLGPNPPSPTLARAQSDITQVGFQNMTSHHETFRWIQGFLQFNPRMKSWHLMYDPQPEEDPYGGEVKMTGPLLSSFTQADVNKPFRIHGHFHDRLLDELGKPQYVIESIDRVIAR